MKKVIGIGVILQTPALKLLLQRKWGQAQLFICKAKCMGRVARVAVGGEIYHVINRANNRTQIFHTDG